MSKNVNPELENLKADYDKLKAELAEAYAEIETLKAGPEQPKAKEGHQIIFISSKFATTNTTIGLNGGKKKVVTGSVNGIPFEVETDKQVEVSDEVAGALAGLLKAQSEG